MFKRTTVILVGLLLSGCSIFGEPEVIREPVEVNKPVIHPEPPEPFIFEYQEPHVITKETINKEPDNVVFQCFEWDDGQRLRIQLEKWKANYLELKEKFCSYRVDIENDPYCKDFTYSE